MKPLISSKLASWKPTPAFVVTFVVSLLLAPMVFAQPGGPPPEGRGWGGPPADRPGRERIETVIIGKFSTELELTPEQAEKFFPRFRQYQHRVEELQRQQQDRRRELDQLSHSPGAERSMVKSLVDGQSEQEQQHAALKRQFLTDVSEILTPQQLSRCAILLDEVPRRLREFMQERQRMREENMMPGPPPGRPGGPRPRRQGY